MKKYKLLASATNKEDLSKLINEYFLSVNYIITDDLRVFNTKLNKYKDNVIVRFYRNRWRFERVVNS